MRIILASHTKGVYSEKSTYLQIVMSSESLIANRAPYTFLVESIQLMFIVHVMIFASDVAKGSFTNVALINCFGMGYCQMVAEDIWTSEYGVANVTFVRRH